MSGTSIVGVDVGGTFTDLFCFDAGSLSFRIAKVPSNRGDEAVGFLDGLRQFGAIADLGAIVHGTTVGTNALLERKGAKVGLITTAGFRDVLEMRRRDRPHTWGLWGDFIPVVDRDMRLEVPERTLADGSIRTTVDLAAVRAAARTLLAQGAEALAIVFINAYANPANERAALTDANVVLGRINAERPIGGKLARLDVEAARQAIATHVAAPLGIDVMAAAEAIVRVANARMAGAIRLVSIERGHDPTRFAAVPFGGGGALHAGALLREVGLKAALVPRYPGVTSALGCVIADIRHDQVQTVNLSLDGLDAAALDARMVAEATTALEIVQSAGLQVDRIDVIFELDMHYVGQTHTVSVNLPVTLADGATGVTEAIVRAAFEAAYQTSFSRLLPGVPARIVTLRTSAIGRRPRFDLALLAPQAGCTVGGAARGHRPVWFDGAWHETAIFARLELPVDAVVPGPAILEQPDATTVVEPGLAARVDRLGNIISERQA